MTEVQKKVFKYKHLENKPWLIAKLTSVRTGYIKSIFRKINNN